MQLILAAFLVVFGAATAFAETAPCTVSEHMPMDELRCRLAIIERNLREAANTAVVNEAKLRMEIARLKAISEKAPAAPASPE